MWSCMKTAKQKNIWILIVYDWGSGIVPSSHKVHFSLLVFPFCSVMSFLVYRPPFSSSLLSQLTISLALALSLSLTRFFSLSLQPIHLLLHILPSILFRNPLPQVTHGHFLLLELCAPRVSLVHTFSLSIASSPSLYLSLSLSIHTYAALPTR